MGVHRIAGLVALLLVGSGHAVAQSAAVEQSMRPMPRPALIEATMASRPMPDLPESVSTGFRKWLGGFRKRALAQGIPAPVFDNAMRGVAYDPGIIHRDRNQSEYTKQIWDYLDGAVSTARIRKGREALARHSDLLDRIEARYGVEKEIVVAIWGLESAYGAVKGDTPIIQALATLAYDGRRGAFFEAELVAALRILASGDITAAGMRGSWAGAMGHTQFMPTSYLRHARDWTGDGKRDIWGANPADALASTAAYLAHFGWTRGQPWGVEVRLPEGFDYGQTGERIKKPVRSWERLGVRSYSGEALPRYREASILLPAGHRGVAFMIFENFHVIERYNPADAYVIGVGHLADRVTGAPRFRATWPEGDRALSNDEKREMQRRLLARGFDPDGVDGIVGSNTIAAIRAFQKSVGLVPDGYASLEILRRLRS